MRQFLRRMFSRFWWLDVVYPIGLAAIIFSSLTYTIYAGKRQMRFAMEAEGKLLEYSLRLGTSNAAPINPDFLTITDGDPYGLSAGQNPISGNADTYASLISRVAGPDTKLIIIHWHDQAHEQDDFVRLESTLASLPASTQVLFAVNSTLTNSLPESLQPQAVNDWSCLNHKTFQALCSYSKRWNSWVIPRMLNILGEDNETYEDAPWTYLQFASGLPAYVLNLDPPQSILHISFQQILAASDLSQWTNKPFVFIGGSYTDGNPTEETNRYYVETAYESSFASPYSPKTPMHIYWAQIARMYLEGDLVYLPSAIAGYAITAIFCLSIGFILWHFGGIAALGMFIVYVILGPFANALGIKYLNVYFPLFNSYYFGLSTFIVAGFGRLSYSAYNNWRLEEERALHARTADLKGNFISLLSHNLNTPVAKMQGMLGLLSGQPSAEPWKADIKSAEYHVTVLEYCIRGVLVASALEESSLNEVARNIKVIREEFVDLRQSSLGRMGLKIDIPEAMFADEDLGFTPLQFDIRSLTASIAALCSLFAREGQQPAITVAFEALYDADDNPFISIKVSSPNHWLNPIAHSILSSTEQQPIRQVGGEDFFTEVQARLVCQLVASYHGSIKITPQAGGGSVDVRIYERRQSQHEPSGQGS